MKFTLWIYLLFPTLSLCGSIHEDLRSKAEREKSDGAYFAEDESDSMNASTFDDTESPGDVDDRSSGCPYDAVGRYDLLESVLGSDIWALECIFDVKKKRDGRFNGKSQICFFDSHHSNTKGYKFECDAPTSMLHLDKAI